MNQYKIIRIAGLHYASLIQHLSKSLSKNSYDLLKNELFDQFYVYSNSFSYAMNALGHQCDEIVYDFKLLQTKWAEENGIKFSKNTWGRDILFAQIKKNKPDILYFQDVHSLSLEGFCSLKSYFPFLRKVIIFRGYPGLDNVNLKKISTADLVFVGSPLLKSKLNQHKITSHLVCHYFDERILSKVLCDQKKHNVTFIGTSGYGYGIAHLPRYIMLDELLKKTQIKLWIDEVGHKKRKAFKENLRHFLKKICVLNNSFLTLFEKLKFSKQLVNLIGEIKNEKEHLLGQNISYPLMPLSKKYKNRCNKAVFGLDMYQVMADSMITLNKHSLAAENFSDNIRMFQATGMGSCLITERSENLHELFEEDTEVVCYSSHAECIEKINFLLKNESICRSIALKGQQKTLKSHTAIERAKQIDHILQSEK